MSLPYGDSETCGPTPAENLYTGKARDAETAGGVSPFGTNQGNDYFGARYYSSVMGRWLSPDWGPGPVPYARFTDPQSLNLYEYVGNSPVSLADPTGHACEFNYEDTHCGAESLSTDFKASLTSSFYAQFVAAFQEEGIEDTEKALDDAQKEGLKPITDASEIEEEEPWQCPGCIFPGQKGPLDKYPDIAKEFEFYVPVKLSQPETYYRMWGDPARITGRYGTFYSLVEPFGSEDLIRDRFSLPSQWNSMEHSDAITIPAGTTVYIGPAVAHPEFGYGGGGVQVWVPNP